MVNAATKNRDTARAWEKYRKPDGSRDKLFEPGWCGELTEEETLRLQEALLADDQLAYSWGWRGGMKRRAVAAIERVAYLGSPDNRSHNVKLVREAGRRPKADSEGSPPCVKKAVNPSPPRLGRRKRVELWEAEMLRLAGTGMGIQKIAKALKAQGVSISGPTVSARLRELKGQLALIS